VKYLVVHYYYSDYSDIQVDDEYEDEEVQTATDESSDPGECRFQLNIFSYHDHCLRDLFCAC